jgi:tungstate transport system permease protein
VGFLWHGIRQGFDLVVGGDHYTYSLLWVTLHVAFEATGVALVVGLPVGLALGLGRGGRRSGRRRRQGGVGVVGMTLGNAGLGLPPVVVGLVLTLLMFPAGVLGRFHLLFTLNGVIVAQSVLAVPVVVALTASAVRSLPPDLLVQARALGAHTGQIWLLALREARVGVFTGVIAALGSAVSEVGAVVLVGGNIQGDDQTLASGVLAQVQAAHFGQGMALGIVVLGLILVLAAALTAVQVGGGVDGRGSPRDRG